MNSDPQGQVQLLQYPLTANETVWLLRQNNNLWQLYLGFFKANSATQRGLIRTQSKLRVAKARIKQARFKLEQALDAASNGYQTRPVKELIEQALEVLT